LDSLSPEVPLDPNSSHVRRSVSDNRLQCAWIFPASSGDAFSRQIRGDAEFLNPSSDRHGPDRSFPERVVRPKGTTHPCTCAWYRTPHSSHRRQAQTLGARGGLKPGTSRKKRAGHKISLEMALPNLLLTPCLSGWHQ